MTNKPLVSILLPNFNNGPYLNEAIDSMLNQSYSNFELLIVDDCSTDNSLDIIKAYKDERILLFEKDKNSGIVDSLNLAIDNASGEFYLRMDGDDISSLDRIGKLLGYLLENPEIGACGSSLKIFGVSEEVWTYDIEPKINKAKGLFGNPIGHATALFRASLFKQNNIRYKNGYPYVEDIKLFSELNEITTFSSLPEVLYHYRRLPNTSTLANIKTHRQRVGLVHAEILYKLLRREATKDELTLHYNLYRGIFDGSLRSYFRWINTLIECNKTVMLYSSPELSIVIERKFEVIKYKALDRSLINIFPIIKNGNGNSFMYLKYVISKLLRN